MRGNLSFFWGTGRGFCSGNKQKQTVVLSFFLRDFLYIIHHLRLECFSKISAKGRSFGTYLIEYRCWRPGFPSYHIYATYISHGRKNNTWKMTHIPIPIKRTPPTSRHKGLEFICNIHCPVLYQFARMKAFTAPWVIAMCSCHTTTSTWMESDSRPKKPWVLF